MMHHERRAAHREVGSQPQSPVRRRFPGSTHPILSLQRTIGNRVVEQLLRSRLLQAKLRISQRGDAEEQEADRVVDQIVSSTGPAVQRKYAACTSGEPCPECDEEEQPLLRSAESESRPAAESVPGDFLGSLGLGEPLDLSARGFFESRFGFDFRHVRVHQGSPAAELAQAVNARAFAVGQDVVFGSGEYAPETPQGRHLLAHELAHVVQQEKGGLAQNPARVHPTGEEGTAAAATLHRQALPQAASESALPALIVEDTAEEIAPGQMKKREFLTQVQNAVCRTAEEGLAGTAWTADGCPWIEYWVNYYGERSAGEIEQAIQKYVPAAARLTGAVEYVELIAARVGRAVGAFVTTGKITGVPKGMPAGVPGAAPPEGSAAESPAPPAVMFKAREGVTPNAADPAAIRTQLGTGQPLAPGLKSRMESAFGLNFGHVRVHTDAKAAVLSSRLNARAFTVSEHVAFGPGEYRPGTLIGDALLAHELAHVAQQRGVTSNRGAHNAALEEDSDRSAVHAVVSLWAGAQGVLGRLARNAMPALRSGLQLQRCGCDRSTETPPTGALAFVLPSIPCDPKAATLAEVRATGVPEGVLGVTNTNFADTFSTDFESSWDETCKAKLKQDPSIKFKDFLYTTEGTYMSGDETPTSKPCKGKTVPREIVITADMAKVIREGEIEHCNDDKRALALGATKFAQAIKELETPYCAQGETCAGELKKRVKTRTGVEQGKWFGVTTCLASKSKERDTKGWHDVGLGRGVYAKDCSKVTYTPDAKTAAPEIGKHSSEDLVKGCDEP